MNDYLLRHAIDNVWCNPTQDRQFAYELQQVTPRYGVRTQWVVEQQRYTLPVVGNNDYWYIYQIGQTIPGNLGLPKRKDFWIPLNDFANQLQTLVDVYTDEGINYPRAETYVLITQSQNLLVAIRANPLFPDLDTHQPYIHFYRNGYYSSGRSDTAAKRFIDSRSLTVTSANQLRQFQIQIMDLLAANKGTVGLFYVNGRPVHEISTVTAQVGDYCDFILDPSIKKVIEFPVNGLPVFNSTLDKERKYILHYPGADDNTIDFYDDITAILTQRGPVAGRFTGVTYHHNKGTWLRQLTHRDYSISTARLDYMINVHPEDPRHGPDPVKWPSQIWTGLEDKVLRLYVRESGYKRPLVAESSRIGELYRLSDANILRLMTGADATNPLWRAENLEKAAYVQFMSADPAVIYPATFQLPELTSEGKKAAQDFAGAVYGYHAAAKIQANNPNLVKVDQRTQQRYVDLPYAYWEDATVFEYNQTGELIDWYYHIAGQQYRPTNLDCFMVECVSGQGGDNLHGHYGLDSVDIKVGYNFRVYVTTVSSGVANNAWQDITDLPNRGDWGFYDETTDQPSWVWTADPAKWYGCVRTDEYFYLRTFKFTDVGVIRYALDNWEDHGGELSNKVLEIPFGQYDVFFNKRPIIEGLDFYEQNMLTVINNLAYLKVNGEINEVTVRGTGFCAPNMKRYAPGEIGFLEYGVLSNDTTYQLHANKVQRIIIDGHYKNPADVVFEEERNVNTVKNERNGAPFQIQTPQVAFRDVYPSDNTARVEDDARDALVSQSMTAYFPKRVRPNTDTFANHYAVFSAFSNKVLSDILNGLLVPPLKNGFYSDQDIVATMTGYEWLKPYDILNRDYNTNHVKVYPHWRTDPIGLESYEYDFYVRILGLYLRQPMDLAPFIYIKRTV